MWVHVDWTLQYESSQIKLTVVNQFVSLQGVGLCESHLAVIAFIGFLVRVRSHVALEFERVRRCVCAMLTLKERHISR